MKLDGLIKIRQDTPLSESVPKAEAEIVEKL
jgi:hypothetical protein